MKQNITEKMFEARQKYDRDKVTAIAKRMEKSMHKRDRGSTEDADKLLNEVIHQFEAELQEKGVLEKETSRLYSRPSLPLPGELFAENDIVYLRMICESDYDDIMDVSYECSEMKSAFEIELFKKTLWNSFIHESAIVVSIIDKKSNEFVGYCSIKDIREKEWEISIEEKIKYHRKGFGYNALILFTNKLTELTGRETFRVRIYIDNKTSQLLFKKLGAIPDGISEFLLSGEELSDFQKEYKDMIDEDIIQVAREFNVEPEQLLGHVLEYKLNVKK